MSTHSAEDERLLKFIRGQSALRGVRIAQEMGYHQDTVRRLRAGGRPSAKVLAALHQWVRDFGEEIRAIYFPPEQKTLTLPLRQRKMVFPLEPE